MKEINKEMTPQWSIKPNPKKEKAIATVVKRQLLPKFRSNPVFVEFFDYLNALPEFTSSSHYSQAGIELAGLNIVEVGGASPISTFLAQHNRCFITESDLRVEVDIDSQFADLVLNFEVIEHIKDKPENALSDVVLFQESGVRTFASECDRVLKPGGTMIATTPNCVSLRAIENAIDQRPPYIFRPHVREYSIEELIDIFSGLDMVHHETMFNFYHLSDQSRKKWNQIFRSQGWSTENRGDDHFVVFRKSDLIS